MIRVIIFMLLVFSASCSYAGELFIYVGSASKPPMQKLVKIYQHRTGTKIDVSMEVPACFYHR